MTPVPFNFHILIAESLGFSAAALARLRGCAEVTAADLDRAGLLKAVGAADVLWVRLRNRIDQEVLDAAPRLKIIATNTTGLNHIDLAAAERRGIKILSLRGEHEFLSDVRATAEETIGLMLALVRHLPAAIEHVRAGDWQRDRFQGSELYGKTVALVGCGRLGRIVARYLHAFDVRVLAVDPQVEQGSLPEYVALRPLVKALAAADIVSLHASLDGTNAGFFGRAAFAAMKPGAYFINTARGELVEEAALLENLVSGRLAGAALDVLAGETAGGMADHPLVRYAASHANLIVTPHLGGNTVESLAKTEDFLAEKLWRELT